MYTLIRLASLLSAAHPGSAVGTGVSVPHVPVVVLKTFVAFKGQHIECAHRGVWPYQPLPAAHPERAVGI